LPSRRHVATETNISTQKPSQRHTDIETNIPAPKAASV